MNREENKKELRPQAEADTQPAVAAVQAAEPGLPEPEQKEKQEPTKKQRIPFYRWLLPWKGDSGREIIYKIISLAALCVFFVCAGILVNDFLIEPLQNDTEQKDIRSIYYAESKTGSSPNSSAQTSSNAAPERDAQGHLIRFVELQKINPDIVGWIKIPNTIIDLPVTQAGSKDPEFYLDHDYNKKYSKFGTVFADFRAPVMNPKTKSMILYGHSLRSGRMFTELNKYKSLDFYRQNPVFSFDTADGESQWKIISVFLTNTLPEQGTPFDYLKTSFKNDSDYLNFVYQMRIRSLFNTGVSIDANDQILLLSTCSYEFDDFRQVVVARKVRSGESAAVDTSAAVTNPKTLYPDCWYTKNGGKKPVWPSTYEQAVKEKVLSWGE